MDVSDATRILKHLFGSDVLSCHVAADANDDNRVDIADAVNVLMFLFQDGSTLAPPYPAPGHDTLTPGPLVCLD